MEKNPEQLLKQGHEIILSFLRKGREKLDEFVRGDKQQKVLLDHAINFGLSRDREIRKQLQKRFGAARSNKSKAKKRLNESLKGLCTHYSINPPIQLYFESSELRKRIIHFACCHSRVDAKASSYMSLNELKDMLDKASELLAEEMEQEDFVNVRDEVEPIIRELLKAEALKHLREKLRSKDENDYQPLELEYGVLYREDEESQSAFVDNLQNEFTHNRKWASFVISTLLKPFAVYILSSDVGTGKTTFLRYLQLQLLKKKGRVPLYIHASKIEKWDPENVADFAKHLAKCFYPTLKDKQVVSFFEYAFNQDKIFFLVDGLDQIRGVGTEYDLLIDKITELVHDNLIIASRPTAVTSQERNERITFLWLEPFGTDAQKRYFGEHYKRARELTTNAPDLVSIPMLAHMVRTLIEKKQDKNIKNRAELYRRFVNYVLREYEHEEVKLSREMVIATRSILEQISYDALAKENPLIQKITTAFCWERVKDSAVRIDDLSKYGLVNLIVERSTGVEDFLYFTHQSFQEFLAAVWAAKSKDRIRYILDEMWNPKWREVIKFMAGLLGEEFVMQICSQGRQDNCIHSRLLLAAECCGEVGETLRLERFLLDSLKKLSTEPPLEEDAIAAIGGLSIPEAGDYLLRVAQDSEKQDWPPSNDSKQFDPRLGNIGERAFSTLRSIGAKLSNNQKHRIIDLVVDSRQRKSKRAGVRPCETLETLASMAQLDTEHVNRLTELILFNEPPYYSCISIICNLSEKLVHRCTDKAFALLDSKNKERREAAYVFISGLGSKGKLCEERIEEIFDWIMSSIPETQKRALRLLRRIKSKRAVPAKYVDKVITMLENCDYEQISLASDVITWWASSHESPPFGFPSCRFLTRHVEGIAKLLANPDRKTRKVAVDILGKVIGNHSYRYAEKILAVLGEPDSGLELKCTALAALDKLGEKLSHKQKRSLVRPFAEMLVELLENKDWKLRRAAADALYYYRNDLPAKCSDKMIEICSKSEERMLDIPITNHLSAKQVQKIFTLLENEKGLIQKNAIDILFGQLKGMLIPYVDRIIKILHKDDATIIEGLLSLLGSLRNNLSSRHVELIIGFLDHKNPLLQASAYSCLTMLRDNFRQRNIEQLLAFFKHKWAATQHYIAELLLEIPERVPRGDVVEMIVLLGREECFLHSIWSILEKNLATEDYENMQMIVAIGSSDALTSRRPILRNALGQFPADEAERACQILGAVSITGRRTEHDVEEFVVKVVPRLSPDSMRELVLAYLKNSLSVTLSSAVGQIHIECLREYIGEFLSLIDQGDAQTVLYGLKVVRKLAEELKPDQIGRICKLLSRLDYIIRDEVYDFLRELYQSNKPLPQTR